MTVAIDACMKKLPCIAIAFLFACGELSEEPVDDPGEVDAGSDVDVDADIAIDCGRGFGLSVDGVNPTRIDLAAPTDALALQTANFTIEMWAHLEDDDLAIITNRGLDAAGAGNAGWSVHASTARVIFGFFRGSGHGHVTDLAEPLVPGWHHVAWTYEDGRSRIFVDGIAQQATDCQLSADFDGLDCLSPTGLLPSYSTAPAVLGTNRDGVGAHRTSFGATYDELRVSSAVRYRSDFEPKESHQPDAATIVLLDFDAGAGGVIRDSSGNGFDGVAAGGFDWLPSDGFGGRFCGE